MKLPEVLPRIVDALEGAGLAYMLTGSFAGAYYGFLRSTQDIDFVIEGDRSQLLNFVESLPGSDFYADPESAVAAHGRRSMFKIIDLKSGWKIDLIIRKSRAFSVEEFQRRRKVTLGGRDFFVVSPEDLIVAKLNGQSSVVRAERSKT